MAGSYRHITNTDGTFRGVELLGNMGDAHEALEECHAMIQYLAEGSQSKIFEAWRDGYFRQHCPPGNEPGTEEAFWSDD